MILKKSIFNSSTQNVEKIQKIARKDIPRAPQETRERNESFNTHCERFKYLIAIPTAIRRACFSRARGIREIAATADAREHKCLIYLLLRDCPGYAREKGCTGRCYERRKREECEKMHTHCFTFSGRRQRIYLTVFWKRFY